MQANIHFLMSEPECDNHHYRVHYYKYKRKSDGILPAVCENYVECNYRSYEEHAYCCHDKIEVYQSLWRVSFYDIIAFDVSRSYQEEEYCREQNLC